MTDLVKSLITDYLMSFPLLGISGIKYIESYVKYAEDAGCESLDDFKAYELWNDYFDYYKDVNGIKPRWSHWKDHDVNGWKDEMQSLSDQYEAEEASRKAYEEQEQERKRQAWIDSVKAALKAGAPNLEVAKRWVKNYV